MSFEMTSFRLFALLLVGSRLSLCCLAQQPQTTAPSSQSAPAATLTSRKQDEKQIEKKEQSQRMLGVVPMFGVTSRQNAPPLTAGGKFHLFVKSAFDPFQYVAGWVAGWNQPGYQ